MGVGAGLYMSDVVKKSSRSLSHLLMSSCTGWRASRDCMVAILTPDQHIDYLVTQGSLTERTTSLTNMLQNG